MHSSINSYIQVLYIYIWVYRKVEGRKGGSIICMFVRHVEYVNVCMLDVWFILRTQPEKISDFGVPRGRTQPEKISDFGVPRGIY